VTVSQVHVRTRPCFGRDDVTCNCAVAFRENDNILGVYACRGRPPVPVRYLRDRLAPADDITVSRDGIQYTVYVKLICSFYVSLKTQYVDVLMLTRIYFHAALVIIQQLYNGVML